VFELVPCEPKPVVRLEMVARCRLAVSGRAAGHELRRDVDYRRLGRDHRRDGEDQAGCYKARAAAKSSSKSGTASFS
jgi:hypothetical protein